MLEDDIDLESDLGSEHTPPASSCDESENDDALHHVQDARAVGEGDESDYGAAGDGDSDHADDGDGQWSAIKVPLCGELELGMGESYSYLPQGDAARHGGTVGAAVCAGAGSGSAARITFVVNPVQCLRALAMLLHQCSTRRSQARGWQG